MSDFNPLVSIVIPVYNGSNYMREAIDSALAQTYMNIEVIVVNDGSNDGGKTEEIAKSYGDKIRYFYKENGGVASALNVGIREMTGEYFSWLSHDDLYLPEKIEKQISFLSDSRLQDTVVYSNFMFIDESSSERELFYVPSRYAENSYLAIFGTFVHGCSTLVPKRCFDKVGFFNEKLLTTQDNEMWTRIANEGFDFVHMPEVLIKSRRHSKQGQQMFQEINIKETEEFFIWAVNVSASALGPVALVVAESLANRRQKKACQYLLDNLGPSTNWRESIRRFLIRLRTCLQ